MCVQDLRILNGLTFRTHTGTAGSEGYIEVPDLSLAYLISGLDNSNAFALAFKPTGGTRMPCTVDGRFNGPFTNARVYTRESLGPVIRMPLLFSGGAFATFTMWWYEMDAETWARINSAFYPPITGGR